MSRRASSTGKGRGDGAGDRGSGGVSLSANVAATMQKLREELFSSLSSTISDTIEMVCDDYEESISLVAQQPHRSGGGGVHATNGRGKVRAGNKLQLDDGAGAAADYEQYYTVCNQLVAYITTNMATSPDFKQQMDRIILACHSNASEVVLSSVVTKKLWFQKRDGGATDQDDEMEDDDGEEEMVDLRVKPLRVKVSAKAPPAAASRGTKRRASAPPPPPPPLMRSAKAKSPQKKRARKDSVGRKSRYATTDDSEEDEVEEEVEIKPKRRAKQIHYSEDDANEEDDDDDDDVVFVKQDAPSQPHYGQADELLNFKDAIGDMCYPDRRTPAQTRFFKDRLRKAIQFVDAQLCKPPKGKMCGWDCAKIRRQMCNRDLPCRNKICRLWHDVEAHTDRCQNTHCEFRIRVMLRETMYKIDHKKAELQHYQNEAQAKTKTLKALKNDPEPDRENIVERRLLDNKIEELEADIDKAEKEIGVFKATKKTYWATLNEIGITVKDDESDQFQNFNAHYSEKKTAAKKKAAEKSRDREEYVRRTSAKAASSSSRSERSQRRQSVELDSPTAPSPQRRDRITRRSTQQSLQAMTNGVIELDDDDDDDANEDEETKTDRSAEYDEDSARSRLAADESDSANADDNEIALQEPDKNGDGAVTEKPGETDDHDELPKDGDTEMADATKDQETPSQDEHANSDAVDEAQFADYVFESKETQQAHEPAVREEEAPQPAKPSQTSVLEAINHVVDASSALAREKASGPEKGLSSPENGS